MDITKNYYRILQVSEDADIQVISAAYRALAKRYHPDMAGPAGTGQMSLLNEAHDVLTNLALRATYDKQRDRSKDFKEDNTENYNVYDEDSERKWKLAAELYPELNETFTTLKKLSNGLANTFKIRLLETRRFSDYKIILNELKLNFLTRYFGDSEKLRSLGEGLILAGNKDRAKELNEMVALFGGILVNEDINRLYGRFYSDTPRRDYSPAAAQPQNNGKESAPDTKGLGTLVVFLFCFVVALVLFANWTK